MNTSSWQGVLCSNGRVSTVSIYRAGASGPLDSLGNLTALKKISLADNSFNGARAGVTPVSLSER